MSEDMKVEEGLYYTKKHEWAKVEDDEVRVGIADYAQDQLGEIVFVELPDSGKEVVQLEGEESEESEIGVIESIKAVSPFYSPVSGEVKEVNEELKTQPEIINSDPYTDGWICVLSPSDLDEELDNLMNAEEYEEYLESEIE
ncbi:glycine cleavage system protein H [candidate division MSBL1 archaeon SCGC-AAA382C18]|uniref:Probable glycine cleavage system H protein n=1 Tax=candidate division MSBL1 archaeon SCGC-AAA382C18 TaxID=1698281 RepID=A0A133VIJ3_9EURY|nr:glycine cleavage system protein H [candidate division MSBL1 archaeon SCGC-AAA382C18]